MFVVRNLLRELPVRVRLRGRDLVRLGPRRELGLRDGLCISLGCVDVAQVLGPAVDARAGRLVVLRLELLADAVRALCLVEPPDFVFGARPESTFACEQLGPFVEAGDLAPIFSSVCAGLQK